MEFTTRLIEMLPRFVQLSQMKAEAGVSRIELTGRLAACNGVVPGGFVPGDGRLGPGLLEQLFNSRSLLLCQIRPMLRLERRRVRYSAHVGY